MKIISKFANICKTRTCRQTYFKDPYNWGPKKRQSFHQNPREKMNLNFGLDSKTRSLNKIHLLITNITIKIF